jgi:hypothetical protein
MTVIIPNNNISSNNNIKYLVYIITITITISITSTYSWKKSHYLLILPIQP